MNTNNARKWMLLLPIVLLSTLLPGCIDEDISICPQTFWLQVAAFDSEMKDITEQGEVQSVVVFVFDENGKYLDRMTLSAEEFAQRKPLYIEKYGPKKLNFVGLANLSGENLKSLESVKTLSDLSVRLSSTDGLAISPNDLFSGTLEAAVKYGTIDEPENIVLKIYRCTSRVNIKIIGFEDWLKRNGIDPLVLPFDPNEVEIRLGTGLDTHIPADNFTGQDVFYRPSGEMVKGNYFVPPFRIFPTRDQKSLSLDIYIKGKKILSFTEGSDGVKFIPELGKMLNILIDLKSAKLSVWVVVTPWEYVYQFVEY